MEYAPTKSQPSRKSKMQTLQIEDVDDCATCIKRDTDFWELMLSEKVKSLDTAWCPECGRQFTVFIPESTLA